MATLSMENPMDRQAWRATVCRVAKNQALSHFSFLTSAVSLGVQIVNEGIYLLIKDSN